VVSFIGTSNPVLAAPKKIQQVKRLSVAREHLPPKPPQFLSANSRECPARCQYPHSNI
jgi:hypothetical protein